MDYPCYNCFSHNIDCHKTCDAYLRYLRQSSVEAEIEELENKLNKPKNEPKRAMPLQVKESDFKGNERHYWFEKGNFSFHIFIEYNSGVLIFYQHKKLLVEDKRFTLSEAVTVINNYLKQLYEEVQE